MNPPLPPQSRDTQAPANDCASSPQTSLADASTSRYRRWIVGGVTGNTRLTAATGLLLLVLFVLQLVTVVLGARSVLTWHVTIGFVLAPPVLLKVASTTWRMVAYYRGAAEYRRAGAPPMTLRLLGPVLVVVTLLLIASGVVLVIGPHSVHGAALATHKLTFYVWLGAIVAHVAPHFIQALRAAIQDWSGRASMLCAGRRVRLTILAATTIIGSTLALLLTSHASGYAQLHP